MFRPIARTAAARAASSHCDMDPSCTCVCGITETAKELAEDSNEVHKDAAVELRVREAESGGVMKKKAMASHVPRSRQICSWLSVVPAGLANAV